MIRSSSSQDEESIFLDEGYLLPISAEDVCLTCLASRADATGTCSTTANAITGFDEQVHSFFAENYDHEEVTSDAANSKETQRRKSVSARFRSVSKDIP